MLHVYKYAQQRVLKRYKRFVGIKPFGIVRAATSRPSQVLFTLPKYMQYTILLKTQDKFLIVYIYDGNYSFIVVFDLNKVLALQYYNDTNSLLVKMFNLYYLQKYSATMLQQFLHIFHVMFFRRMRVFGRLYRIYKRNKYRDLQYRFGNAHNISIYVDGLYFKYVRKKRIRAFGYDYKLIQDKLVEAYEAHPQNIYTERGICIENRVWKSRIGKVQKYY